MPTMMLKTVIGNDTLEYEPIRIAALGYEQLRDIKPGQALELRMTCRNPVHNGRVVPGPRQVTQTITFREAAAIVALVPGGWLPMPFGLPSRFLVDRNVVVKLAKIRRGDSTANGQELLWWTQFFESGNATFNPLPYALEGGLRRKPTFTEFKDAYDQGASELVDSFPKCHVVKFEDRHYRAAYDQLEAFDARYEREAQFLLQACPMIVHRVAPQHVRGLESHLLSLADSLGLQRAGIPVLAVLSCLYEDPQGAVSIGRKLLKPRRKYSPADAYNALSDVRHIEVAAAGQVLLEERFLLCTCDIGLASLWTALNVTGQDVGGGRIEFTFTFTQDLFGRLSEDEIFALRDRLRR
jgi:hypothetical protein